VARIIAMANQKGGVGKTTTTINLAASLAEAGNRVLIVDLDPQGAASVGVGVNAMDLPKTIYDLLCDQTTTFREVAQGTSIENCWILPANIDLSAAEVVLVNEVAREQALKRILEPARELVDIVLIDCPPSLGLLTVNALTAADEVIIPLECEYFALRGMALLVDTIEKVRQRLNPALEIKGVIPTMVDNRTLHTREVLERVHEAFGAKVFSTQIPRTVRFAEAPVTGQSILAYAGTSKGAAAYRRLAEEVMGLVNDETSELAGGGRTVPADQASGPDPVSLPGDAGPSADGGSSGPSAAEPDTIPLFEDADRGAPQGERPATPRGEDHLLLHRG
jgi:chromosome partitioning protein